MIGWDAILALVFSGIALWWNIHRDRSSDMDELMERVSVVERKVAIYETAIERLEKNQSELSEAVKGLQIQIHNIDVKLEKILTCLEQQEKYRDRK
ncbi:hypothetical protein ACOJEA_004773 [Klebsiella aerogenes]